MLGRSRRVFLVTIGACLVVIALLFLEFTDITSRQQVANSHPQQSNYYARQKEEWTAQVAAVSDWLDRHREWINVISTVLIAVFTGTLWGATRKLSHFASIQARDMQDLLTAARDNAAAASSQERAIREQAEMMAASVDLGRKAAEAAQLNAAAANAQVELAAKAFILPPSPVKTGWAVTFLICSG